MMTCEMLLAVALLAPGQLDKPAEMKQGVVRNGMMAAEPIEVMRSLLLHKLDGGLGSAGSSSLSGIMISTNFDDTYNLYRPPGMSQPMAGAMGPNNQGSFAAGVNASVEGAYLDGYGVVFTVTLPATNRDPRPGATGPKETPGLSDWDRARKALRGESAPEKTAVAKTPAIGDVLLNLLAENGKHFTALRDDERVTIAVTFRGGSQLSPTATKGLGVRTSTLSGNGVKSAAGLTGSFSVQEDRVSTFESIGDLHLKQNQPQLAIEAYAKAVAAAEIQARQNPPDGNDRLRAALLKLSQAYLAAGKIDDARQAMDRAAIRKGKSPEAPLQADSKSAVIVRPARLTISAPKKLLDQVGNGKMSLDDFRKQATIESVPMADSLTSG